MSKDGNDYYEGETFRSKCGRARITYHPDWDTERPWVSYVNGGTAWRHHPTLISGVSVLRREWGYVINTTRQEAVA